MMLFEQMTIYLPFLLQFEVQPSALSRLPPPWYCELRLPPRLYLCICHMNKLNIALVMEFGLCEPLQGWSRHWGHSWSRREYLGEPEKCFESEFFFWKPTKKATWQKSTSVPILVMQCSISDIVSTRRSWLHLNVMELFIVYCWYVVRLCPPGLRATHCGGFFPDPDSSWLFCSTRGADIV